MFPDYSRASFWAIIVSQENITQTGCPINMETRSTLIFSFCISATAKVKPLLKSLDSNLQGATLILIFFKKLDYFLGSAKNETKPNFFFGCHAPTPFFQNVPRFCFFRFMYPGTWIWENKILRHFWKKGVGAWCQKKFPFRFFFCRP